MITNNFHQPDYRISSYFRNRQLIDTLRDVNEGQRIREDLEDMKVCYQRRWDSHVMTNNS